MESQEGQEVLALNLNIESLDDLIMKGESILIEVHNRSKAGLLLPDAKTSSLANTTLISWNVVKVGEENCIYPIGCQIINVVSLNQLSYYTWGDRNFIMTSKYNISLAKR